MSSSRRLLLAAFLTDASLYLVFAALPFRAMELGAGPVRLGILPTLYAAAYTLSANLGGRVSDRIPRLTLARGGAAVFLLGAVALAQTPSTAWMFLVLPVLGIGLGWFWSPVMAAVADRAEPGRLTGAVARFNIAWSLGKGGGLVLGGWLTETLEPRTAMMAAAAPVLLTVLVLPRERRGPVAAPAEPTPEPAAPRAPEPPVFLPLAWITNALAFGTASTLNMHAPRFLLDRGGGPSAFGLLLGSVFIVQTATFLVTARRRPGRSTLFAAYGLVLAGLAVFLLTAGSPVRLVAALPLGVGFGLAYATSIHASLDRPAGRGRAAGWHESLLGAGSSTLPLLGGALIAVAGGTVYPFLLAGGLLAAGLVVSRARLRRA
ncbi:MAG: MFS transporter [Gemmatimonadetes bacterium]|nr:MFS transporter [Gemmatimonadota bacterium]